MSIIAKFKNPTTKFGKYLLNNFIAWDQKWNVRLGGDPDETISSRLGKDEQRPGGIKKHRIFSRVLAKMLNRADKNHCENAIEKDEGKDSLANFKGGKNE
jgi:hypothetical protein